VSVREQEDGSDDQPDLATQIFARNVELEKENRLLREEIHKLKDTPIPAVMFEPIHRGRPDWSKVRRKIEAAAEEKYGTKKDKVS
jgi:hypothetical protein